MNVHDALPLEPDLPANPPDAYVEALVRRAGTSFFWGMRRLDAPRRRAVFAVYAFCRDVDDIADGDLPLDRKRALLDAWRGGRQEFAVRGGKCLEADPLVCEVTRAPGLLSR